MGSIRIDQDLSGRDRPDRCVIDPGSILDDQRSPKARHGINPQPLDPQSTFNPEAARDRPGQIWIYMGSTSGKQVHGRPGILRCRSADRRSSRHRHEVYTQSAIHPGSTRDGSSLDTDRQKHHRTDSSSTRCFQSRRPMVSMTTPRGQHCRQHRSQAALLLRRPQEI